MSGAVWNGLESILVRFWVILVILGYFGSFRVIFRHFGPVRLKCISPKVGLAMAALREGGPLFFIPLFFDTSQGGC